MTGLPSWARVRLRGAPTAEEALAVLLALDEAAEQDAAAQAARPVPSGWVRAARLEGLGALPIGAPRDLDPATRL